MFCQGREFLLHVLSEGSLWSLHSSLSPPPPSLHALNSNYLVDCEGLSGHPCFKKCYVFFIKVVTNPFEVINYDL